MTVKEKMNSEKQSKSNKPSALSLSDEKKLWLKLEGIYLLFSFALPYVMALFFYLASRFSLEDVFNAKKYESYLLIGIVIFVMMTFFSWYLFWKRDEFFYKKSTKWILIVTISLSYIVSPIMANSLSNYIVPLVFCGLIVMLLLDEGLSYFINAIVPIVFFLTYFVINDTADIYEMCTSATIQILCGFFILISTRKQFFSVYC